MYDNLIKIFDELLKLPEYKGIKRNPTFNFIYKGLKNNHDIKDLIKIIFDYVNTTTLMEDEILLNEIIYGEIKI